MKNKVKIQQNNQVIRYNHKITYDYTLAETAESIKIHKSDRASTAPDGDDF